MSKVLVIGGGAAGMIASIAAAKNGQDVVLIEQNEKLGKKLYITGKGRCNITNASDIDIIFNSINTNPKFLYSSIYTFNNLDTIDFFESIGVKTKIERGNRVFPLSDKSSEVINALNKEIKRLNIRILLNTKVKNIVVKNNQFERILLEDNSSLSGDAVIIATGGLSYQTTGSTGDGYQFAKSIGHHIVDTQPSLVPLSIKEDYIKDLQGLSLKNVNVSIYASEKLIFSDFGEMLFTHFGVSGPLILSGSSYITKEMLKKDISLKIDFKPALSYEQMDLRILKDFEENKNKVFKNSLDKLLPQKLIPIMIDYSKIPPNKKVNEITKSERLELIKCFKEFSLTILGKRSYNEAVITKGGINVKEIEPSTMQSKLAKGVYFAGEVLDVDAMTGGFNLQIAWSTGYLAGNSIVQSEL